MAEVGNFLVKAEGCGFRFGGGGVFEGNRTNTYFETYLPQTSPKIRDWVPLRKWKEKKYIIIYYITTSTLTPRQGRTLTTHEDRSCTYTSMTKRGQSLGAGLSCRGAALAVAFQSSPGVPGALHFKSHSAKPGNRPCCILLAKSLNNPLRLLICLSFRCTTQCLAIVKLILHLQLLQTMAAFPVLHNISL